MADHKIILASVAPGSEGAVVAALAKVLSQSEDGVKPIVGSVPIILMDGLEVDQAQAIATAMGSVKQIGGNLVISAAPGQNMPHVDWPTPPNVAGRDIASYRGGAAPARPPSGVRQAASASTTPHAASLSAATIACPHCGKTIALQASPAGLEASAGIRQVPVSQALGAPAAAGGAAGVGRALPEVPDVQGRVESPPPAGGVPTSPMDLEEFERGVGGGGPLHRSGDTLLQQLDKALEPPPQQPKPPQPRSKQKKPSSSPGGPSSRTRPRSPGGAVSRGRDRKRRR